MILFKISSAILLIMHNYIFIMKIAIQSAIQAHIYIQAVGLGSWVSRNLFQSIPPSHPLPWRSVFRHTHNASWRYLIQLASRTDMQWRQIPLAFIGWRPRYVTLKTNGAWFVHTKRCLLGLLFSLNSGIQDSAVSCIVCIVQASSWPASLAGPHRVSEQLLWLKWGGGACLNSQAIQPSILDMIYYTSEYNEIGAIIPPLWSHSLSLLIPPPYWSTHYHCLV